MKKKCIIMALMLGVCLGSGAQAANIILVTETIDSDGDGIQDDQGLVDWLVAEGHEVHVERDMWKTFDPVDPNDPNEIPKLDLLDAADLILFSRGTNSGNYDDGDEPTLWNSVETPLIQMSAYLVRSSRWKWVDSTSVSNLAAPAMMAVDAMHPVLAGVSLDPNNLADILDPNVGADPNDPNAIGQTSFVAAASLGNGKLIAQSADGTGPWVAEWEPGAEFYEGAGQSPAAKRMLFMAGTQETKGLTPQGAFNLNAQGELMLRNAIYYLLGAAKIVVVNEYYDSDGDGAADDQNLIDFLKAAGHYVVAKPDNWKELDDAKLDELDAADLVIVARSTNSGNYDDGDEPTLWNSVETPLIQMNSYLLRSSRWKWINSTSTVRIFAPVLQVVDPNHPTLVGITPDMDGLVDAVDPAVGADPNDPNSTGEMSFVVSTDVGNGALIAQTAAGTETWIAEWQPGVEFYEGAGQAPAAKRMAFMAGTQEVSGITPQGMLNLSEAGELMLLNAIDYLLIEEPDPAPEPEPGME
jgi:hypothetical protein